MMWNEHLLTYLCRDIVDHKHAHADPHDILVGSISEAVDGEELVKEFSAEVTTSPDDGQAEFGSPPQASTSADNPFFKVTEH